MALQAAADRRDCLLVLRRHQSGSVHVWGINIASLSGPAEATRQPLVRVGVCDLSLASAE
jgi:hypothetical protein